MMQSVRLGVIAGVLLASVPAGATPLQVEVAGAGEVLAPDMGEVQILPGNLAGVAGVAAPKMIHPGHHIDGMYCHQFGFSFRAVNLPQGQVAPVLVRVAHPLWTLPDGRSGTEESWPSMLQGNQWAYVGYAFTESWSLVPGEWVFTVSQSGRVLTQQSFTVDVAPGQVLQGCAPSVS